MRASSFAFVIIAMLFAPLSRAQYAAPDVWFDNLEHPDMRSISLFGAGCVGNRPSLCSFAVPDEVPSQLPNIYTGFTNNGMLPGIVQDGANCHGGSWCSRADLNTGDSGTIQIQSGYTLDSVPLSINPHQFFRTYIKWPVDFTLPAGCLGKLIYMRNTCETQPCGDVIVKFQSSVTGVDVFLENTSPSALSPTFGHINFDGQWHYLEAEINSAPGDQHQRLWIDNPTVAVVDWVIDSTPDNWVVDDTKFGMYINPPNYCYHNGISTGQLCPPSGPNNCAAGDQCVGNFGCVSPRAQSFWVDDLAQSTARIGPITPAAPVYPLKVSSNSRYLVDQNNQPFLVVGDAPQALVGNVSLTDATTYFSKRKALGFNSVWVNLLCDSYSGCHSDGTTYDGIAPFTSGTNPLTYDLSTPNPAYFQRVDDMLRLAADAGMVVFLDPIETGGWGETLDNNGTAKVQAYGQFVGARYKNFTNIVWLNGNDLDTVHFPARNTEMAAVIQGIANADPNHLQTAEIYATCTSDDAALSGLIQLDGVYTYAPAYYNMQICYNKSHFMPVILQETDYQYGNNWPIPGMAFAGTPFVLRHQEYWTMTSGAAGYLTGNDKYVTSFAAGWQDNLNTVQGDLGAIQFSYWQQFFSAIPWYNLVPDQNHTLVTDGLGIPSSSEQDVASNNYVTASATGDGTVAVVYLPQTATITVDMSRFSGPVTAQWFDPTNNSFTAALVYANSGPRQFSSPGNNGGGDPDWVLLFQVVPPDFSLSASPSGISIMQGSSGSTTLNSTISGSFSSAVDISASGLPPGVTATIAPLTIAPPGSGTSTLTFNADMSTPPGDYTVTITGSSGGLTRTTNVGLTIAGFALSSGVSAVSVAPASSVPVSVTTEALFGFNAPVTLSASGLPSGISVSFTPNPIAAPGTGIATMTITAAGNAALGSNTIMISASGGGITHTTTINLRVEYAPVSRSGWRLLYVDSQATDCGNYGATNSFDGNIGTMWITQWCKSTPALPHEIQIDLGAYYIITGFQYLPRQDQPSSGNIANYEFYVSSDGANWGPAAASGTLMASSSDKSQKQVGFSAVTGRYIRLRGITEVSGGPWTNAAEINIIGAAVQSSGPQVASVTLNPGSIPGGSATTTGTVTLTSAPLVNASVVLSSSNASVATVPVAVTVNAGTTTATFTATSAVSVSTTALSVINAAYNGSIGAAVLTVTPSASAPGVLPRNGWRVLYVDSQATDCGNYGATNAFDGIPGSIWVTEWCHSTPATPHEIQIDLGNMYMVSGFQYLPRQDQYSSGNIANYQFYVSVDGVNWGAAVATGTLMPDGSDKAQKQVTFTSLIGRYVRLRALSEVNGGPWTSAAEINVIGTVPNAPVIGRNGWRVLYVDSQATDCGNYGATNAFDGSPGTMWITEWCHSTPPTPHEIQIDLGGAYYMTGFQYLPRQDQYSSGNIANYEFYVSTDGTNWGVPVASGTLMTNSGDKTQKQVTFTGLIGRYVRLRALSEVNAGPWTNAAEINVLAIPVPISLDAPQVANLTLNPVSIVGGDASTATVVLTSIPSVNATVTLTSSDTSVATVPAAVTVAAGTTSASFPVFSTSMVTTPITSSIRASLNESSATATLTVVPPPPSAIPRTEWQVLYVDSQATDCGNYGATNSLDGNPGTMWITGWCHSAPPLPHELQIDVGATYTVTGFQYLPRQDQFSSGNIANYEFYVSTDGTTWTLLSSGTLVTSTSDKQLKQVAFAPSTGRYVRLRALSEVSGGPWTNVAEFNVLGTATGGP